MPGPTTEATSHEVSVMATSTSVWDTRRRVVNPCRSARSLSVGLWTCCSLAGPHSVPDTANGPDEPGLVRVVAELAAQVADVHVDEVLVAYPRRSPDGLDEPAVG